MERQLSLKTASASGAPKEAYSRLLGVMVGISGVVDQSQLSATAKNLLPDTLDARAFQAAARTVLQRLSVL